MLLPRLIATTAAAFAPLALAHTGQDDAQDFLGGLLHPLTGLDHALAMLAVGALASMSRERRRWQLPTGFIALMITGLVAGRAGFVLPQVEAAVAASVAAMGVMLIASRRLPPTLGLALVCAFGLIHGNAHGAEMPAAALAPYAAGFVLATAVILAAGYAAAVAVTGLRTRRRQRLRTSRAEPGR